jgi:hypothetical protein
LAVFRPLSRGVFLQPKGERARRARLERVAGVKGWRKNRQRQKKFVTPFYNIGTEHWIPF